MKHIKLFEQFVNEKAYRLTGFYASKGLIGRVMQTFKKQIERTAFEGDREVTLQDINKEWEKFQKTAQKIVLDQVEKAVNDMNQVLFVTLDPSTWIVDKINGLNQDGLTNKVYISLDGEFVINVGFMDNVDSSKFRRKLDKEAYNNTPLANPANTIYGTYDSAVGYNNLEIRDNEIMVIDAK